MRKEELINIINLIYDVADKITNVSDNTTKFFLINLIKNSLIEDDDEIDDEDIKPLE